MPVFMNQIRTLIHNINRIGQMIYMSRGKQDDRGEVFGPHSSQPPIACIVTFRRGLIGPRLASCNELLLWLDSIHLVPGSDELRWSLTKNGVFSVGYLYKALCIPTQPVLNNKSI
jgi:hypothetical protein